MQRFERPWGYYEDIYRSDFTVFKKIVVYPQQRLSYQYHNNRDELWSIASGYGLLHLDDDLLEVEPGKSFYIERKRKHSILNSTVNKELVFYEMQTGLCNEEDIIRIHDIYGR